MTHLTKIKRWSPVFRSLPLCMRDHKICKCCLQRQSQGSPFQVKWLNWKKIERWSISETCSHFRTQVESCWDIMSPCSLVSLHGLFKSESESSSPNVVSRGWEQLQSACKEQYHHFNKVRIISIAGQSDIIFIPFPFMWQPRSLAGHKGAGKESSSKNSLCGSPPGKEDTATMFSLGKYGRSNCGSVWPCGTYLMWPQGLSSGYIWLKFKR